MEHHFTFLRLKSHTNRIQSGRIQTTNLYISSLEIQLAITPDGSNVATSVQTSSLPRDNDSVLEVKPIRSSRDAHTHTQKNTTKTHQFKCLHRLSDLAITPIRCSLDTFNALHHFQSLLMACSARFTQLWQHQSDHVWTHLNHRFFII